MKTVNSVWLLAAAVVCGVAVVRVAKPPPVQRVVAPAVGPARETVQVPRPVEAAETVPANDPAALADPNPGAEGTLLPAESTGQAGNKSSPAKPGPSQRRPKEPIQDPVAREALSFVGADPLAEEYWYDAINDPSLSAHERKDLIEDLNEDGLSNPKHPGQQDLPLILSRLALILALAPDAMDQVNSDAFAEAYKDLSNMYASLMAEK